MNPDEEVIYKPEEIKDAVSTAMEEHLARQERQRTMSFLWFLFGMAMLGLFLAGVIYLLEVTA